MSLPQTVDKYINITLSELLERALKYGQKAGDKRLSPRERAISRALSVEVGKLYNLSLGALGPYSSSKLALENKKLITSQLSSRNVYLMSDEDISEIIIEFHGQLKEEREKLRNEVNKALTEASLIIDNLAELPQVQKAIKTLALHGMWGKDAALNLSKRLAADPITLAKIKPRGNHLKGGLVNKYIHEGFSHSQATAMADKELGVQDLNNEVLNTYVDMDIIPEGSEMSIADALKLVEEQYRKPSYEEILGLVPAKQEEVVKSPIGKTIDYENFDDFVDPEDLT